MEWLELTLDEALARADGCVALKLDASWCSMCVELDRKVLKTQAADELFAGMLGVRADFDRPETRALVERFAILDLPTLVIVGPDGEERGRVTGFRDRQGWLKAAQAALTIDDPVGVLKERIAEAPDDPRLALRLAELLLSRDADAAVARLEALAWRDEPEEVAAHALFLLGRYHHRVLQEPDAARFIWRELASRFGHLDYARGAYWWHALAQADRGRPELGSAGLEARVRRFPKSAEAVIEWARFVGRTQHEPDRERVRDAAMKALGRARGHEREQLEEMVLQLGRGFDEPLPKL